MVSLKIRVIAAKRKPKRLKSKRSRRKSISQKPKHVPKIILKPVSKPKTSSIKIPNPRNYGREYARRTGAKTFTVAIPQRIKSRRVFIQDYNFKIENNVISKMKKTGSASLTEKQYTTANARREANIKKREEERKRKLKKK